MHVRKFSYIREDWATDNPCVSLIPVYLSSIISLHHLSSLYLIIVISMSHCFICLYVSVSTISISLSSTIYLISYISKTIAFFSPPRSFSHSTIKMAPAICRRSLSEIVHDVFSVLLIILSITEHIYFFIC